jgi:GT2 family glycosyltransferase
MMVRSEDTRVAVLILNHNGRELLLACLRSLAATEHPPLYVVVVDNGSSDGSVEAVQAAFPAVHVCRNDLNLGVAGGRNSGIRWIEARFEADYVVFLDNDTQVEPGTVAALVEAADSAAGVGLVAPKAFRRKGDPVLLSAGGMAFNPYTGSLRDVACGAPDGPRFDRMREIQAVPGFAFLARTDVLRAVGGFDEAFNPYGWEDVDLSLRASKAGFRILYAPAAVVYHAGGRAGRGVVSLYERQKARRMFYFVRRHTTGLQWICFLTLLPFRSAIRIVREISGGNGKAVWAWLTNIRKAS